MQLLQLDNLNQQNQYMLLLSCCTYTTYMVEKIFFVKITSGRFSDSANPHCRSWIKIGWVYSHCKLSVYSICSSMFYL